jgi:predicted amidohydrolase
MRNICVASVQFEHIAGNKQANLDKIRYFVEKASKQNVKMIVFPECCITGYWFLRKLSKDELMDLAEPVFDGSSSKVLISLSKEYQMTVGAGLIEISDDKKLYNTYIVAMPNGDCRLHRKIHAFVSEYISSGSEFTVFDTPNKCRVGVLTCYDNNIIENVRITALMGAEILFAPHQTGGCNSPDPHTMGLIDRELWENRHNNPQAIEEELRGSKGRGWLIRWLPSRAHDNGIFIIFSNGIGIDDDEIRTGNAMVIDPYGRIITETCKAGDDMVIADLDASLMERNTGKRWIKTRRPELYKPLTVPIGIEQDTRTVRFDKKGV